MSSNGEDEAGLDPRFELAAFGKDVENFIETDPIGQFLVARAQQQMLDAMSELTKVSPTDTAKIIELQIKAQVADAVRGWLGEAIEAGRSAQATLQADHDESRGS